MSEQTWQWDIVREALPILADSLFLTVGITAVGMLLALVFGIMLSVMEFSRSRLLANAALFFKSVVCSTPLLLHLFILFYALPPYGIRLTAFATGSLTFMIYYGSFVSNTFSASVRSIPRPILESCAVLGMSPAHAWRSIILPLATRASVAPFLNYCVMCFKETGILVVLGLPILLGRAAQFGNVHFRYLEVYTLTALFYLACTLPFIFLFRRLERRHVFE